MIDKKLSKLEQLEQDIWLNFCYYYQCELALLHKDLKDNTLLI